MSFKNEQIIFCQKSLFLAKIQYVYWWNWFYLQHCFFVFCHTIEWGVPEISFEIHNFNFQFSITISWVEIDRQLTLFLVVNPDICWFDGLDKQNILLLKSVITLVPVNNSRSANSRCLIFQITSCNTNNNVILVIIPLILKSQANIKDLIFLSVIM